VCIVDSSRGSSKCVAGAAREDERPHLKIGPAAAFIDAVLKPIARAPRKPEAHGEAHLGTDTFEVPGWHRQPSGQFASM